MLAKVQTKGYELRTNSSTCRLGVLRDDVFLSDDAVKAARWRLPEVVQVYDEGCGSVRSLLNGEPSSSEPEPEPAAKVQEGRPCDTAG